MNDIIGVSLPGTPAITVGSNRKIAWSFTNAYGDSIDWVRVLLHPADPLRYRSPTGWKAVTVYQEVLHVRGAPDETLDVYETEWGPILSTDHDGTPLAQAWTAHRPGSVNMALTALEQAETVDEAVSIAQNAGIPAQNFIVGDRQGEDRLDHRRTHSRAGRRIRSNTSRGLESSRHRMAGLAHASAIPSYPGFFHAALMERQRSRC